MALDAHTPVFAARSIVKTGQAQMTEAVAIQLLESIGAFYPVRGPVQVFRANARWPQGARAVACEPAG